MLDDDNKEEEEDKSVLLCDNVSIQYRPLYITLNSPHLTLSLTLILRLAITCPRGQLASQQRFTCRAA